MGSLGCRIERPLEADDERVFLRATREFRGDIDDDRVERRLAPRDHFPVEFNGSDGVDAFEDELGDGVGFVGIRAFE